MTPDQRRQVMGWLNVCSGRAHQARNAHDWAGHREWAERCDYWRTVLEHDTAPPGLFPTTEEPA
jgi:hypothetical protein